MLNEAQERSLSVTLRIVEDRLREIEQMIEAGDYKGVLKEIKNDVPPKMKDKIREKSSLVRNRIKMLTERFDLVKEPGVTSRLALSRLSYCWEILQDARSQKLKRFGSVAEGLGDVLDPPTRCHHQPYSGNRTTFALYSSVKMEM